MVESPNRRKSIRLWPGVALVALQFLVRYAMPLVVPDSAGTAVIGGVAGGLLVLLWWIFFSRAPWLDRLIALPLLAGAVAATSRVVDKSIATGMMGFLLPIYSIPLLCLALVLWAAFIGRREGTPPWARLASLAAVLLAACSVFTLLRTDGIIGDAASQFTWRWTPTAEEKLLARKDLVPTAPPPPVADASPAPATAEAPKKEAPAPGMKLDAPVPAMAIPAADTDWPGFRGPQRDGVIRGGGRRSQIQTDWKASTLQELWRRPVGPGWSSFAVRGGLVYTQEQRGEDEVVAAYNLTNGAPVWVHKENVRFWESNAGAGPRATPEVSADGRTVYAMGATGILTALDSRTGAKRWSRNVAAETGAKVPEWGIAGSPLVIGDVVVVAASSHLASYESATGKMRWHAAAGGTSYGSPQLMTLDGVKQVVLLSGPGATSVDPADGKILWQHSWTPGAPMLQPTATADGAGILITTVGSGGGVGTRYLTVARKTGGNWTAGERWTSTGLKPYFNDLVVHKGHAYGFDGTILACIDLADGKRKWKGGRFGHGQLILLPDQDLLLVLSEDGELGLVSATPDSFNEVGSRFRAMDGKTWNHPVLVGNDTLLVRNGEEMVALRLPLQSATAADATAR